MKYLEVSLYNLSFLILTKKGRVHNLFTHAFVMTLKTQMEIQINLQKQNAKRPKTGFRKIRAVSGPLSFFKSYIT